METENSFLIISRSSPYSGQQARAALDLALTAAAFEHQVIFVFIDDGVMQLMDGQNTLTSELKNIGKIIPALEIYDVKKMFVHQQSADSAGLTLEHLPGMLEYINDDELKSLVSNCSQVMVF